MADNNTGNIIGNNIRRLRLLFGETQADLAKRISGSRSSICEYESGKKVPTPDVLNEIAIHYGKTVDELSHTDLTSLKDYTMDAMYVDKLTDSLDVMFPTFGLDKMSNNEHIRRGYSHIKRIIRAQKNKEDLPGTILGDAFSELYEALKEDEEDDYEVAANFLWVLFIWWESLVDIDLIRQFQKKYNSKRIKNSDFLEMERKNSKDVTEQRQSFVEDFDELINSIIEEFKATVEWSQLGDYYLALRYLLNMVDDGLSIEMNKAIGTEMMFAFVRTGNKYAIETMRLFT
ncbi:MAG: helix-turn-helix transcriptional regulator [Butyrivibrio sp.]|jgi:transcriptional regulator with XRE-family HTH domain|nr:helix-turn-helix transcriptional regulator [Butyrivibrio sp.]